MKYKHIQLVSLLIDFLTTDANTLEKIDIHCYLEAHDIKYPEKALHELTLEVQERLTTYQ